eukprot:11553627-Alexandrium_andersonii.AAC.1
MQPPRASAPRVPRTCISEHACAQCADPGAQEGGRCGAVPACSQVADSEHTAQNARSLRAPGTQHACA